MGTTAIILADQIIKEQGEFSENVPACLVTINREPLLKIMLDNLKLSGIKKVVLVIQSQQEKIRLLIGPKYKYMNVHYVINTECSQTGTLESLCLCKEYVDTNNMIIEGDLLCSPSAIESMMVCKHRNVFLSIPTTKTNNCMHIIVNKKRWVCGVGKEQHANGLTLDEYMGVTKISDKVLRRVYILSRQELNCKSNELVGHVPFIFRICKGMPIRMHARGNPIHAWARIHTQQDITKAETKRWK